MMKSFYRIMAAVAVVSGVGCGGNQKSLDMEVFISFPLEQNLPSTIDRESFLHNCRNLKLIVRQYATISAAYMDSQADIVDSRSIWLIRDGVLQNNVLFSGVGTGIDGIILKGELPSPNKVAKEQCIIDLVADIRGYCYYNNVLHTGGLKGKVNIARHEYSLNTSVSNNRTRYVILNRWYKTWDTAIADIDDFMNDSLKKGEFKGLMHETGNSVRTNLQYRMYYISSDYVNFLDPSNTRDSTAFSNNTEESLRECKNLLSADLGSMSGVSLVYANFRQNMIVLYGDPIYLDEIPTSYVRQIGQDGVIDDIDFGLLGSHWRINKRWKIGH